ncbi:MAG: phosphate/phosphite/phosphonate ABC transporter substrate-binding protein [Alphaproteobacteria bacterium]|nr:phosphate/phosphite/phosphonate ABC transporter substrate-binding protein [Alphaproteobacteria bacterium]
MIVSLPMYDLPEVAAATEAWWQAIRAALRAAGLPAPDRRDRPEGDLLAHWLRPDLLLSQTCGLPYRSVLHERVELMGTPDFGLEGCPPGHYCSVIVVRAGDRRRRLHEYDGARLAYNDAISQSGWAAPLVHAAASGIRLRPGPRTGAHRASIRAVAEGQADLAAIDAVTWRLLRDRDPVAAGLRECDRTSPTPGLPCIAARGQDARALAAALTRATEDLAPGARAVLGLRGIVPIAREAYLALDLPPLPEAFPE